MRDHEVKLLGLVSSSVVLRDRNGGCQGVPDTKNTGVAWCATGHVPRYGQQSAVTPHDPHLSNTVMLRDSNQNRTPPFRMSVRGIICRPSSETLIKTS
ncbi:hypothetical protein Pmani_031215 [Petrolisthes manimaculis]|uniref:Uncharacterized protein n=1 Tax=Petrolisthes manimaculis TaxID=1843537 RepID=A0AAE1NVT4_9EUCA|nr:hypothetical protein Pmani_035590 [Petrolisthes manimaculis]KAK4296291.1 hypothetical protein Pmani_031215 [Petrolisthes manimaculis]